MNINQYAYITCFLLLTLSHNGLADETQEFTFVVEPAYTQEYGEWQVNLALNNPSYHHDISTNLEAVFALEYGISDEIQAEFSVNRGNELEGELETEMSEEYEFGLSYMFIEQQGFIPQLTMVAGVIVEESEYGYEAGLLYSYQVEALHFIHGNFIYEDIDNESEITVNFAYAVKVDESWTLLAEVARSKESAEHESSAFVNTFSTGVVFETQSDIELGLAYLIYNADTVQDYSWQFKAAYEF